MLRPGYTPTSACVELPAFLSPTRPSSFVRDGGNRRHPDAEQATTRFTDLGMKQHDDATLAALTLAPAALTDPAVRPSTTTSSRTTNGPDDRCRAITGSAAESGRAPKASTLNARDPCYQSSPGDSGRVGFANNASTSPFPRRPVQSFAATISLASNSSSCSRAVSSKGTLSESRLSPRPIPHPFGRSPRRQRLKRTRVSVVSHQARAL